jgi:hypothetical protein
MSSLALGAAAGIVIAVGCSTSHSGSGSNPITTPPANQALLRFVHGIADARAMDVWVNGAKVIPGLVYLKGTSYEVVDSGLARVEWIPKDDTVGADVVLDTTVEISPNHTFSFYAVGPKAGITPLYTPDSNTAPKNGDIKLRVVHIAPGAAGALDVYVTTLGDSLPAAPTIAGLGFKTASLYQLETPGDYEIRITLAGSRTVAVDDTLSGLTAGAVRTAVVMDNLGGGQPLHAINLPDAL